MAFYYTLRGAPATVKSIWAKTGYEHLVAVLVHEQGLTWEAASARLLQAYRHKRGLISRYSMRVCRRRTLSRIAEGHAFVEREMGGVRHVALYFGKGTCSSSFVPA